MSQVRVRTWNHLRKGKIRGVVVSESGDWMDIELVGDQDIEYVAVSNILDGPQNDGDVIRVRKSFMNEVYV